MLDMLVINDTLLLGIKVAIVIIVSFILYGIIKKIIKKVLHINIGEKDLKEKKEKTIYVFSAKILKIIISVIDILIVLEILKVNTTAIIAALGAFLVVIGLAFQELIKDFISGVFFLLDNMFDIGDIIEVGGYKGKLIDFGLKSIRIEGDEGDIKIIPNHKVVEVINYSINKKNKSK